LYNYLYIVYILLFEAMLVSDFILNSVYRWINQKLPSYLLGHQWVVNAINYSLNDLYTFEWKYWTFMYDSFHIDLTAEDPETVVSTVTLPYPILRAVRMKDLWLKKIQQFENVNSEPFDGLVDWLEDLADNEFRYKPHGKTIKVKNNGVGYVLYYIHHFDAVEYTSTIPVPDIFLWVLYNLVLGYIYPNYWQTWENKEANVFTKARQQLTDLAKTDSLQLSWIEWLIK